MYSKFSIWIGENEFMIYPNTEIYFTPSLYKKLQTKLTFTGGFINLTDSEVKDLQRNNLFFKDNKKFYILVNRNPNAKWKFKANDFVLTNDYVNITTPTADKQDIFNFRANDKIDTIKVKAPKDLSEKTTITRVESFKITF